MPSRSPPDGLYLVKCVGAPFTLGKPNVNVPIDHYAIMDVGNRLGLDGVDRSRPVVVHQTPPSIRAEPIQQSTDCWTIVARIEDEEAATQRLRVALQNPEYNLGGNNCEHFARFVAGGSRESTQLFGYAVAGGVTLIVFGAIKLFSKLKG